ncbi:hypothetical protein NC490_16585 [Streptomyces sp. G1]|nr:hypothetical protein [Streptomyces sp. G1]MCM1967937.1 hypothetical protein [Streptomyces sp. G1]
MAALAVQADYAVEARPFGRVGQAQNGVDVVAFSSSDSTSVYQAKKYEKFTAADLSKAVQTYANGERPFEATRLVVVTTADVRDTRIDLELVRLRKQHSDLTIELWGRQQLSDMLFALPDLVRRFFGEPTMRMFCRPLPTGESRMGSAEAVDPQELDDYLSQLGTYLGNSLPDLVPLTLQDQAGSEHVSSGELAAWLLPGRHVQVAGKSGTGKSHTLIHTTLRLVTAGWLPVFMRASTYEGRLQDTLDECVAPFIASRVEALVQTARIQKLPVVLLVDAINECPAHLQERLVQQITTWCRSIGATVVSSSQEFVHVPEALRGTRLKTTNPDAEQRSTLLHSYGPGLETDRLTEERYTAFSTAFELSLAAGLTQHLPPRAERGALLDLYVGEQLQQTTQPTAVRQVLHDWALLMDERLAGWLPLSEAQRSATQLVGTRGTAPGVVDAALASSVVRVRHHRLEFQHEWYAHLLTAEALMWRCSNVSELAAELRLPHRRNLAAWAIPMHSDPEAVRSLLRELPADGEVLTDALRGQLGQTADDIVLAEARRCLERAIEAVRICRVVHSSHFKYTVEPCCSWNNYEQAMFTAVGTTARDGRLLEPLARLLRETDRAFRRGTPLNSERSRDIVPAVIAATLHGPMSPSTGAQLPAATITHAARLSWPWSGHNHHQPASAADLHPWIAALDDDDVGLTVLLCTLLRNCADTRTAALAPALFTRAWDSDANHLQSAGLDLLTSIRSTADTATVTQVIELLNDLQTDELFVSTLLVDALHVYGQVTSPYHVDDITEEITSLLANTKQSDAHARAKRILESQFEDVIAAPFTEAIEALEPAARQALLILAVGGGDASMFTDFFLRELVRSNDPASLPALQYWASHVDVRDPFPQGVIACHLLGIEGCAAHLPTPPPLLDSHRGADANAWRCYGQILFWLHHPRISPDDKRARCMPLWEQLTGPLLDAAPDPLHQFQSVAQLAQDLRTTALGRIADTFPTQVRTVLHHALRAPDRLTSLFRHTRPHDRTSTALSLLARVGDSSSLSQLAAYRDNPAFAASAASVIRGINDRRPS